MADAMQQQVMTDPKWREIFQLVSDKQVAIKLLRKQKEILMSPDTHQMFEKGYDPTQRDGFINFSVRI